MQVSTSTSAAPINSAPTPIIRSAAKAARRTPPRAAPAGAPAIGLETSLLMPSGSRQWADVVLQQRPDLVAHLFLHVGIEPGFAQRLPERLGVGRIEGQPAGFQLVHLGLVHHLPVG